jgi:N-acetylglucosamine kinase-like BadF-type ATPase
MDYIIGVDGGGTKTEVAAYNLRDEKIAESTTGPGNPAVDYNLAEKNILLGVSQCLNNINTKEVEGECRGIYMGIAGIEVKDNKSRLEAQIRNAFRCHVIGVHDSELAHAAIFNGNDGIITIAGTGSVSYGRYKGKTHRTGGWGHVLGDEGSGYWIALEALKRMTLEADLGMKASTLSQQMLTYLGVHSVAGMKDFVLGSGKYEIAAATVAVVRSAQKGDEEALEILDRAGQELAVMTERLCKKLEIYDPVEIGFSGGILLKVNQTRESFRAHLESNLNSIKILEEAVPSTKGACYFHRMSTI